MTYTKEQQAENRAKWTAALRSGDYLQGQGKLRNESGSYCCLGVACDLATQDGVGQWRGRVFISSEGFNASGVELTNEVTEWLGLASTVGFLTEPVTYTDRKGYRRTAQALTTANDEGDFTFDQIADLIENGKVNTV